MPTLSLRQIHSRVSGGETSQRMFMLRCGGKSQEVFVVETGRYDLHIATERPLTIADSVSFEMDTGFPAESKSWRGIVHWNLGNRSLPESGIALSSPVPPELVIASASSMRASIRYNCKITGKMWSLNDEKKAAAKAVNYSRTGICLQTAAEFKAGDRIRFEWYSIGGRFLTQQLRSIDAVVRWFSPMAGVNLVGCETPSDALWCLSDADVRLKLQSTRKSVY